MIYVISVNNQQEVTPVSNVTRSFAKCQSRVIQKATKRYITCKLTVLSELVHRITENI